MKKLLPILTIVGLSAMLTGCNPTGNINKQTLEENINSFKNDLYQFTNFKEKNNLDTKFNKYNLSILTSIEEYDEPKTLELNENDYENLEKTQETLDNAINENESDESNDEIIENETNENQTMENSNEITENLGETNKPNSEEFSTLYSLSCDIENSCDEFSELKEEISSAIYETENLINKIKNNEIELSREQRMFLTEQSCQLKSLGKQLSNVTNELSYNLSDLKTLLNQDDIDTDSLSLKYLIMLDNLLSSNQMLQNSLNSINLMNQMMFARSNMNPNNRGRILYGFQQNNEDPIIKDYIVDENGELIENKTNEEVAPSETENSEQANADTIKTSKFTPNIDTYRNQNSNIDTFFNTALLDNEFMFGNRGYGGFGYGNYGNYNPNFQPYYNNYPNQNYNNNTQYSNNEKQHTQNIETKKKSKKFKINKNIDTYKDDKTPSLKTRFSNIKQSVVGFFNKFKPKDERIQNPVYRDETTENEG